MQTKHKTLPSTMIMTSPEINREIEGNKSINMTNEKIKGVLLLLSASMGIGCLGIPSSIAQVGFYPWIIIICFVALFYYLSYYVIMKLCVHYEAYTVNQLGSRILNGNSFIIDFLFVIVNLAGYLACLITLNEDFPIIAGWLPSGIITDYLKNSEFIWLYISTLVTILILVYIPVDKLHSITFISAISSICLLLFISFGLLYRSEPIMFEKALSKQNWNMKYHIFMFLGFAFLCQQNLMTLRQASNIRELSDIMSTVRIFTFCILIIYFLIGIMGYLTFYDNPKLAKSNVLALYQNRDIFYGLTMMLVNLNIQVGNAVMLYPIRDIIMEYIYGPKPSHLNENYGNRLNLSSEEIKKNQVSIFFRNNKAENYHIEIEKNNEKLDQAKEKINHNSLNVTACIFIKKNIIFDL